jgi:hypothetical protein
MHLLPAYGRDYKSKKAVEADFMADKDFIIADVSSMWNDKYVNRPQLIDAGVTEVNIRYCNLSKVCVLPVK